MSLEWKKLREHEDKVGYKWVTTKIFKLPDGEEAEFTTWHRKSNDVAVIALTVAGKAVIARQFRPGPERVLDELPGGDTEPEEELSVAAARELREETGYATDEPLVYLGAACRDAYTNETNHYFFAKNCRLTSEQELDDTEFAKVVEIPVAQLIENAKTGMMSDGVAVLMALDYLKEGGDE